MSKIRKISHVTILIIVILIIIGYIFGNTQINNQVLEHKPFDKNGGVNVASYIDVKYLVPLYQETKRDSFYYCLYINESDDKGIVKLSSNCYNSKEIQKIIENTENVQQNSNDVLRLYGLSESVPQFVYGHNLGYTSLEIGGKTINLNTSINWGSRCINAQLKPVESKGIISRAYDVLRMVVALIVGVVVPLAIPAIILLIIFVVCRIVFFKNYFERKKIYKKIEKEKVNDEKSDLIKLFSLTSKEILIGEKIVDPTGRTLNKISKIKKVQVRLAAENNAELSFAIDKKDGKAYQILKLRETEKEYYYEISYDDLNRYIEMSEAAAIKYKKVDKDRWKELCR